MDGATTTVLLRRIETINYIKGLELSAHVPPPLFPSPPRRMTHTRGELKWAENQQAAYLSGAESRVELFLSLLLDFRTQVIGLHGTFARTGSIAQICVFAPRDKSLREARRFSYPLFSVWLLQTGCGSTIMHAQTTSASRVLGKG